jgi:autotransporter-associated beta strand protein
MRSRLGKVNACHVSACVRHAMLSGTVLASAVVLIISCSALAALADGGGGGNGPGIDNDPPAAGGAGGADGANGQNGTNAVTSTNASGGGGGGGGAGGGIGGHGGMGGGGTQGGGPGQNGDSPDPNFTIGAGGGGGGNGGAIGQSTAGGVTINAPINGGDGSNGGNGGNTAVDSAMGGGGGGGGAGGHGLAISGATSNTNSTLIKGGNGGAGGNGGDATGGQVGGGSSGGYGASGGAGGVGVKVTSGGASLANNGLIQGGNGGAAGQGGAGSGTYVDKPAAGGSGGNGGAGGAGVQFAAGGTLVNAGIILGGNGAANGAGGSGSSGAGNGANGIVGPGGVGVIGAGLTLTNSGTISGGLAGDGVTRADALFFSGGNNTLTLQNGSSLNGNIEIEGNGTLMFNQSTGQTISNVITGNGSIIQNGGGTLNLTGLNTYTGATLINMGTLSIGNANALGVGNGIGTYVEFTGNSTLEANFTGTLLKGIEIDRGVSATIGATAGHTLTLAPQIADGNVMYFTGGPGTTVHFGSSVDTGTVVFTSPGGSIEVNGAGAVDGGTLKIGGNQGPLYISHMFGGFTVGSSTTPATFDLNGFAVDLTNLTGTSAGIIANSGGPTTLRAISNGSSSSTFAGVITDGASGPGGLSLEVADILRNGGTTLILTGANTYTGTTTIDSGQTLQLGNGGTSGSIVSAVVDRGTLIFDRSNSDTYAGVIAGPGVVQQNGSGTTILTAASTYTGATLVNAGMLEVDGSITHTSGVTVNSGGALAGTGTVATTTVMSGGALAPGSVANPSGTLAISGNLAFQSGALYVSQTTSSGAARADVSGTATLTGAIANPSFATGSSLFRQYTILTATGGLGGTTFASLVNTNLPRDFKATLSYDANDVFLNLSLSFVPPGSGLNENQLAVANAITNVFNSTGSLPFAFGNLTPAGLTQASGESATGTQQTTFDAMNQFMRVMTDPFVAGRCDQISAGRAYTAEDPACAPSRTGSAASGSNAYAAMYTKAPPPVAPTFEQRWRVWAAGYGASQTSDGNAVVGSNNMSNSVYGTVIGADYRFSSDGVAGFALAGGGTNFNVIGLGYGRSELFQAGAFVRQTMGPAYIIAALAYGWQDVTTDRTVTTAGFDQLRANFNANAWSGRLESGYRFVVTTIAGGLGITPYAAGQFTSLLLPAYGERAAVGSPLFALNYAAKTVTDAPIELGIRTDKSFAMQDSIFTMRTRLAWVHDFDPNRSIGATFQTLPGASFVVNGAAPARDAALTTTSAEWSWTNGWSASATFEAELSNTTQSYGGRGIVRYVW